MERVQITLEPASSPSLKKNKNAKIQVLAYFEPFGKLGSLSLESGAYLQQAKNLARAFEPDPRLGPPLVQMQLEVEKGPIFLSPLRAGAHFKPELFTNKTRISELVPTLSFFENSARAYEPMPRLVPPNFPNLFDWKQQNLRKKVEE